MANSRPLISTRDTLLAILDAAASPGPPALGTARLMLQPAIRRTPTVSADTVLGLGPAIRRTPTVSADARLTLAPAIRRTSSQPAAAQLAVAPAFPSAPGVRPVRLGDNSVPATTDATYDLAVSGMVAGDLILCIQGGASTGTFPAPAGATVIASQSEPGLCLLVSTLIYGGSGPITFSNPLLGDISAAIAVRYSPASLVDTTPDSSQSFGVSPNGAPPFPAHPYSIGEVALLLGLDVTNPGIPGYTSGQYRTSLGAFALGSYFGPPVDPPGQPPAWSTTLVAGLVWQQASVTLDAA